MFLVGKLQRHVKCLSFARTFIRTGTYVLNLFFCLFVGFFFWRLFDVTIYDGEYYRKTKKEALKLLTLLFVCFDPSQWVLVSSSKWLSLFIKVYWTSCWNTLSRGMIQQEWTSCYVHIPGAPNRVRFGGISVRRIPRGQLNKALYGETPPGGSNPYPLIY